VPHERLSGEPRLEQLIEERDHLLLIHRVVEVRCDSGEVDLLAEIVVAAVFQPLEEDGDPLLGRRFPRLVDQPP
jgi:hypothetical protein